MPPTTARDDVPPSLAASSPARFVTATVVTAVQLTVLGVMPPGTAGPGGLAVAMTLAVLQGLALWKQQDHVVPCTVMAVATAGAIQMLYPPIAGGGALPALFGVASLRPPRRSLWVLGAVMAFAPFQALAVHWRAGLVMGCGAALTWTLGELNRLRIVRREEEARRIADAERSRIAAELHDVVAHHVSVVVVQAAAADDVFDSRPDRARTALRAIESTGRMALAELRRVVQTLPSESEHIPAPGLSDIEGLAESLRATGMEVSVHRDAVPVPEEAGVAVYRIVQESLTNVVRHAAAKEVTITVAAEGDWVTVEIRNDGAGASRELPGTGRGIRDMRRRAHALGGGLDAAPGDDGFTVRARIPLPTQPW